MDYPKWKRRGEVSKEQTWTKTFALSTSDLDMTTAQVIKSVALQYQTLKQINKNN